MCIILCIWIYIKMCICVWMWIVARYCTQGDLGLAMHSDWHTYAPSSVYSGMTSTGSGLQSRSVVASLPSLMPPHSLICEWYSFHHIHRMFPDWLGSRSEGEWRNPVIAQKWNWSLCRQREKWQFTVWSSLFSTFASLSSSFLALFLSSLCQYFPLGKLSGYFFYFMLLYFLVRCPFDLDLTTAQYPFLFPSPLQLLKELMYIHLFSWLLDS